jgi:hypothetical protein
MLGDVFTYCMEYVLKGPHPFFIRHSLVDPICSPFGLAVEVVDCRMRSPCWPRRPRMPMVSIDLQLVEGTTVANSIASINFKILVVMVTIRSTSSIEHGRVLNIVAYIAQDSLPVPDSSY